MLKPDDLIEEAVSLPIEIRTKLVNKLLESLNPTEHKIDELWVVEAEKRVEEIRTGKVKTIPGEDVFRRVRDKFNL